MIMHMSRAKDSGKNLGQSECEDDRACFSLESEGSFERAKDCKIVHE